MARWESRTTATANLLGTEYEVVLTEWDDIEGNYQRCVRLSGCGPFSSIYPRIHGLTAADVARNLEAAANLDEPYRSWAVSMAVTA